MANWLWSIPPYNYGRCLESGTFAVRKAGLNSAKQVQIGDTIFAYLPGESVIAGVFRAACSYFHSADIIWPDGTFPHRVRVAPVHALPSEARVPLDSFKHQLEVGRGYPNFGLVIQKVVHPLPDGDAQILMRLVEAAGEGVKLPVREPEPVSEPPRVTPPDTPPQGESLIQELHRAHQKVGLLERKVRDLEVLLALAGPNLEDYLRLAHSSQGVAFEEATRQCLTALGFTLDADYQGQPGEIDFVAVAPFFVFGECQASGAQNVSVAIVDKLMRHRRRYLLGRGIPAPEYDCKVAVSEFATAQLVEDAASEGVAVLRPSQLAALLKLKREYPGSVHPYNLRAVFSSGGDVTSLIARFIDSTREEIEKRVGIIEVLKNDRFKPSAGASSREPGWIQARVESELEAHIPLSEIEDILTELTSPLVGCVGIERNSSGRGKYFYIRDYDFQVASVGPRVEQLRL
jgi:hypothetical protein